MDERLGIDVSRETCERLEVYAALLSKWTRRINLVSAKTLPDLWQRHMRDSAQLLAVARRVDGLWADLGSGGGLPGAVIAILGAEQEPPIRVACVESDRRKAAFLNVVSRETGVPFEVIPERAEAIAPLGAAVVSARALAPLDSLLGLAARHLAPTGIGIFPKGAQHRKERMEAEKHWQFACETFTSCTDPSAVVYKVGVPRRV